MKKRIKKIPSVYIADEAVVCGNVSLGKESSIWYGAVVRADVGKIEIGDRTNIQDNCVLHCDKGDTLKIGSNVTVGHGCILHGCTIGDCCIVGMGSIIINGAKIGENCLIGAGAVVTGKMNAPDGSLIYGNPAVVKRKLTEKELARLKHSAAFYVECAKENF